MKKFLTILPVFMLILMHGHAQLGQEWINFSQSYFKIPVAAEGMYKLSYTDLQNAGFPVGVADPRKIQLFHRGIEQSIRVSGSDDGVFDPTDVVEFYGRKNDGTLDARLYATPSAQAHQYYNLFSDTTAYFLTIGSANGKRIITHTEGNDGLSPETYHMEENLLVLANQYAQGEGFNDEIYSSAFVQGEGWTGGIISINQTVDYNLSDIQAGVSSGGVPKLEILLLGRGAMEHKVEIYAGTSLRLVGTVAFSGFNAQTFNADLNWADMPGSGNFPLRIRVVGIGDVDRISVSYVKLLYPQEVDAFNRTGRTFRLAANAQGRSFIQIKNAPAALRLFDVTNLQNIVQVDGQFSGSTFTGVVPATGGSRKLFASAATVIPKIIPVNFRPLSSTANTFVIITHPLLRKPAMGYDDPVKAYAAYRASVEGGGYDTLLVNIQQLYNQFSYGETSSLAIYNFMKFLSAAHPPRYLFLVGKGLEITYKYHRSTVQPAWVYKDLVPVAGSPGSDLLFTASGNSYATAVPTGRLTAMKPEQVAAYLNKVKETEALPYNALWRKNILHLSGGIEEGEPETFRSFLSDFAVIAEDHYLGGEVSAIAKRSRDVQVINIAEAVNKGLGLVTFFGHSSPSTLDFDIGYVTDPVMGYNNPGKYPMLLMNGCEAGAFFLHDLLFGEDWIFADKKGATGFIAHASFGLVSTLRRYSETLYRVAYSDSVFIGKGIGDIQQETAARYMKNTSSHVTHTSQVQQMILLGDPAVKLFGATKADLDISANSLTVKSFEDKALTALSDSFAIQLIVRNFGRTIRQKVRIEVERTLNDRSILVYDSLFDCTKYSDTLLFVIRKGNEKGFGNNAFKITVDPDNIIDEFTKENNTATIEAFIPLNATRNLYPSPYAIVSAREVNLSFQITDLLSDERDFLLEVDTVHTFNSPYRFQTTVKGTVLARYAFQLLEQDSLAYYWRTKLAEPRPGESDEWTESSFTYIGNGHEGWAQVHFPQFLRNASEGLNGDVSSRRFSYLESVTPVEVTTFGIQAGKPRDSVSVKINGAEYNLYSQAGGGFGCRNNTINLIAFDRRSTAPYAGLYFKWYEILYDYGNRRLICGREPFVINSFTAEELVTGNHDDLIQYVDNIALGDSVLLYSMGDARYNAWPIEAKNKLSEFGISVAQIDMLSAGEPVVIMGKKGLTPGLATVYKSDSAPVDQSRLEVKRTITGRFTSGSMSTGLIGPARAWESFHPSTKEVENSDDLAFDVVGVGLNGDKAVLLENVTGPQDLSIIDAEAYPYIVINFNTQDEINLTPPQLRNWIVLYTPVPEGMLLFTKTVNQVTLHEGEPWQEKFYFLNISEKYFDGPLTVETRIFNQAKNEGRIETIQIDPPAPGDTTSFLISRGTTGYAGMNDVSVFVNPRLSPEQYYDNNVLELNSYIHVREDNSPPLLDVTIDGRHIISGDYVSPTPFVVVKLWDENSYSIKTDTVGMRMWLTYPCAETVCAPTKINLSSTNISWYPATDTTDFYIEFSPGPLEDGFYTLRVEGADQKGNVSGVQPYEVGFVVQNEATLTLYDPYPNPFSDEVMFDFLVTGKEVPASITLQIFEPTGKLARKLEVNNVASFYVGTNRITWNGTDGKGNVLPKGLYFYSIHGSLNERQYRKQGKLVLVR